MKPQGGGLGDVVIDRPRQPDDLNSEIFENRPRSPETTVSSYDDQRPILDIGGKTPHPDLLHPLIFKIFKSAPAERAARVVGPPTGVSFGHGFDPIVDQSQKAVSDESHCQPEPI